MKREKKPADADTEREQEPSDTSIPDGSNKRKDDAVVDHCFPHQSLFVTSSTRLMRQRGPDSLRDTEVKLVPKVNAQINKRFKQSRECFKHFYFF